MRDLAPTSALSHVRQGTAPAEFATNGVTLSEEPLSVVLLFETPNDTGFQVRVASMFGVEARMSPNTVAHGRNMIAWIAPGQWLVIGCAIESDEGVDMSDAYCAVGIRGEHARDLLAKGVPIDLDPGSFAPLQCARTLLGSIPIFIMARDEANYLILVERGLAHAAWAWLEKGALSVSK